jgi:hypothetical protein
VVNIERPEALINVAFSVSQQSAWEREIAALASAPLRTPDAPRMLVVHTVPSRQAPPGVRIIEAWRYLLDTGQPDGKSR